MFPVALLPAVLLLSVVVASMVKLVSAKTGGSCGCGGGKTSAITSGPSSSLAMQCCKGGVQTVEVVQTIKVCDPLVFATCSSKRLFSVDPDTSLVRFFSCVQSTLTWDEPADGCCPTSSEPLYFDPCKAELRVDLPTGTYSIDADAVFTLESKCCTCEPLDVFYSPADNVMFYIPPVEASAVATTLSVCPE